MEFRSLIVKLNPVLKWQTLLNLGARKLGIISVAPIGCCPSQRIFNATGGCIEELNDHAKAFHSMLDVLMHKLTSEFEGLKYSLGNAFEMTINVIQNPLAFSKQFLLVNGVTLKHEQKNKNKGIMY